MISIVQGTFKQSPLESLKSLFKTDPKPLVSRQEIIIDFKSFISLMKLRDLNISAEEYMDIETLFNSVKNHDEHGSYLHANLVWDKMINLIDQKVTECNFRRFSEQVKINQEVLTPSIYNHIKRLYFLTDFYALNGRVSEAQASWKVLMMLLDNELEEFIAVPLNQFDGAIPEFN